MRLAMARTWIASAQASIRSTLRRTDVRRNVGSFGALILVGERIGLRFDVGGLADQPGGKLRIRGGSSELKQQRGLLGEIGFAQHVIQSGVEVPTEL